MMFLKFELKNLIVFVLVLPSQLAVHRNLRPIKRQRCPQPILKMDSRISLPFPMTAASRACKPFPIKLHITITWTLYQTPAAIFLQPLARIIPNGRTAEFTTSLLTLGMRCIPWSMAPCG
jgi:hypothetical protein